MTASLSRLQTFYSELQAEALLHAMMTQEFKGRIACFSSFGAYSALLLDMIAKIDKSIPILFLETGKHFKETLEYVEQLCTRFGFSDLRMLKPDPELLKNSDPVGELWQTNVNRCCWLRKVEPLERELKNADFEAIITGRRRYQTNERSALEAIELDEDQRYRINPFWSWSKNDIKNEFNRRGLPQHPLVEKGYPSIGCEPCTKAVRPGEDERSGRWAHTIDLQGKQKTECGIHVPQAADANWSV